MKVLGALAAGVALGFWLGWVSSPGPFRHFYRGARDLKLVGVEGKIVGTIPAGSPLLSDEKLLDAPDLGWWAYVPVTFHDMRMARTQGVVPSSKADSIGDIVLSVQADVDDIGNLDPLVVYEGKVVTSRTSESEKDDEEPR